MTGRRKQHGSSSGDASGKISSRSEVNKIRCYFCGECGHRRVDCLGFARSQGTMRKSNGAQLLGDQTKWAIKVAESNEEEDSELESEEDPEEEDPEEDPEEEPSEEESGEERITQSYNNDRTQQVIDDPDEDEDPSEEEYSPHLYSEDETNDESDYGGSSGKKRSSDVTSLESQKKSKYEEAYNQESDVGCAVVVPDKQEQTGSSGKRRRSRWDSMPDQEGQKGEGDGNNKKRKTRWSTDDSQLERLGPLQLPDLKNPEQEGEKGEDDGNTKKRKTRWSNDKIQLKMLGPLQLPDLKNDLVGFNSIPEIQQLQAELAEINKKLQKGGPYDERPEHERSPSPPPSYNNLGLRINTREVRMREKLVLERGSIMLKLIQKNPTFGISPQPSLLLTKKIYIPVKKYPNYNFFGIILGPRGNTLKRMEKESGATICLRGKGSKRAPLKNPEPSDNDDLHVLIRAESQHSLDVAVKMIERLLIPVEDGLNGHKQAQLAELAKIASSISCNICRETGHKSIACPQKQHTFQDTSDVKLFVGYLPQAVDNNRLRELFSPFGKITRVVVKMDVGTGKKSKHYGLVTFENVFEAELAVKHMNGYQLDGHRLVVRVAGCPPGMVPIPSPSTQPPTYSKTSFMSIPNYGPTSSTTFPLVSKNTSSSTALTQTPMYPRPSSSTASLPQFPGDPDYPGSQFMGCFEPAPVGPSSMFYFGPKP